MKSTIQYQFIASLYKILKEQTDETHPITLAEIMHELENDDIHADRRRIYRCMESLKESGIHVQHVRIGKSHGYYLPHLFSSTEAFVLMDAITSSSAFSESETNRILKKIETTMSAYQRKTIPPLYVSNKTENNNVLEIIQLLLSAISTCQFVEFKYFDITIQKNKKYRKNGSLYKLTPYAIVSESGKFYGVFYDHKHAHFSNYRLDKIESLTLTGIQDVPKNFSLSSHMRNSMKMFHGDPATVTAIFDIHLASQVIDQFGNNLIVSKVTDDTFTASIRTTISPTLRSWFLLFFNQIEVLKPDSFRKEMCMIGQHLIEKYKE